MQRSYFGSIVGILCLLIVLADLLFKTGKELLFLPAAVTAMYINFELNILTRNHNTVWKRKMQRYIERLQSGGKKSVQDKVFGDLTFTIHEGWTPYALFLGVSANTFLIPQKLLNPIESLLLYVLIFYSIMMDYANGHHPRKLTIGAFLIIFSIHITFKILGVDLIDILVMKILA